MIKETLLNLGLTSNEIEIYLTLINNGELSVNEIGTKAGLHRQVCYDALDRLIEKGFVSYINKQNKKYFKSLNPNKILDLLDDQKQELDLKKQKVGLVLPQLMHLFNTEKEETEVEVVKGKNVLRTIYKDIFNVLKKTKEKLYVLGVDETKFIQADEIAIKQHVLRFKNNKLKELLLTKESATDFLEGHQSEYRLIPDHLFNPTPTQIYGDKIAIIIWGKPMYSIIIKNKQVADANRKYFKMLWGIAKLRK